MRDTPQLSPIQEAAASCPPAAAPQHTHSAASQQHKMDGFAGSLDDSISAASTCDVQDRLSALELRVQQQEDEITVLKAALADVLRRLAISEDQVATVRKAPPSKGPPTLREAHSIPCITNGGAGTRKPTHTGSVARKDTLASAAKSSTEKKKEKPPGVKEESNEQNQINRASPSSPHPPPQPAQSHRQEGRTPTASKRSHCLLCA
ncbi:hypothetical protein GDO81_008758 [Engystomops pustulosus]|uniref:Echinoderm microtubule-associated protein-like 4 n=1 Tax=Engystomops pustulosus TaxID=76066 RepID=A0AAV7CGT2_ENGPU|nr:hypothetical protein GDO81_008758 [Engystomops pustulosus]